ncbi:MAG: hypothetical protein WEH44_07770, partial [Pirellulaceae bacterium]
QLLSAAARQLERNLADVSRMLSEKPLNLPEQGAQAEAARQATADAGQAMQQSLSDIGRANSQTAARKADEAATLLRQAGGIAAEASPAEGRPQSPVPGEVGDKVARAAQRLAEAQQKLAQAGERSAQKDEAAESDGKANAEGDESQANSEADAKAGDPLAQSATHLEQAADSLADAAQQLQPGQATRSNERAQARQQEGANARDGDVQPGVEADLSMLESELRQLSKRNWGELPGQLRTEILQSSGKKSNSEYARMIKLYFEEIAKTRPGDRNR